ncbi:MAG: hydrolase 1, exosortase A system-associated [Burkholderiales bacterium]|nr:hydrolase 1, exosortase A system-associated [Burkholderiales bacterium]
MKHSEKAFTFSSGGLVGIVSVPETPANGTGVLVIVGGPQYRIGSHRQFTLLCRDLAAAGIPAMRFDYTGMGDSEGPLRNFEEVEEDIQAAVETFFEHCDGLKKVVLWGLCDAATSATFHAWKDPRISGMVLLNPWVRTIAGEAKARMKHYYLSRLVDPALWRKILTGKFDFSGSTKDFIGSASSASVHVDSSSLPERMRTSLEKFQGKILFILSGNDLTAREFDDLAKSSAWRELISRTERHDLAEADHTFSRRQWRDRVYSWTIEWILKEK